MIVAGVDIGSTTAKAAIMKDGKVVATAISLTGADCNAAAEKTLLRACQGANIKREDVSFVCSTGYGRNAIDFGDSTITEITANAKGAVFLGKSGIRTIIDVGGQDTKTISLDEEGNILNFAMNDKCAAGTGRFLEVIARVLQEDLASFAKKSLLSKNPAIINSTCTVFAESEVISLISKKVSKEDIIAGIHKSIAKRICEMAKRVGLKEVIFFDGGGARNIALKKAIEEELGMGLFVPKYPQLTVALGAAIIAMERKSS